MKELFPRCINGILECFAALNSPKHDVQCFAEQENKRGILPPGRIVSARSATGSGSDARGVLLITMER